MPKTPDYGDELDYGNGVTVARPTDEPTGEVFEIPEEAFMGQGGPDDTDTE